MRISIPKIGRKSEYVKPANILVISNRATSSYDFLFKLADLGLSHFKMTVEGERAGAADDAYGTQTYGKRSSSRCS